MSPKCRKERLFELFALIVMVIIFTGLTMQRTVFTTTSALLTKTWTDVEMLWTGLTIGWTVLTTTYAVLTKIWKDVEMLWTGITITWTDIEIQRIVFTEVRTDLIAEIQVVY